MLVQFKAGEPPERTAARSRRLAETQQKMAAASAEMAARDAAATQEAVNKVDIREQLKPRMEAWQKGKQVRIIWGGGKPAPACNTGRRAIRSCAKNPRSLDTCRLHSPEPLVLSGSCGPINSN